MAELLARSGERVGWLGLTRPILARNAAEKLAEALILAEPQSRFPTQSDLGRHSDLILFGDFLDPVEDTSKQLNELYRQGARGHVVQIIDPVEEVFPYQGRIEFSDPETGEKFTSGNASLLREEYEKEIALRASAMRETVRSLGWNYTRHHTDRLASEALASLHVHLSQRG